MTAAVRSLRAGLRWGAEPNPVLVRELRARFRSRRAFVTVSAFVALLAVAGIAVYASQVGSYSRGYNSLSMGQPFAGMLVTVELLLVTLIAPALTMNAISGERDRRTYELLLATPLSSWSILRGKLFAAFAYVLILAFAVLPVMSLAFVFGGVSASQVVGAQVNVVVSGFELLMIGLFWSSWLKSSGRSAVATYVTVALIGFAPVWFLYGIFFVAEFVLPSDFFDSMNFERIMGFMMALSPSAGGLIGSMFSGGMFQDSQLSSASWWLRTTGPPLLLSAVLFILAGSRIRPSGRRPKLVLIGLMWLGVIWFLWAWGESSGSGFP